MVKLAHIKNKKLKCEDNIIIDNDAVRKELVILLAKCHDGNLEYTNYFLKAFCMDFVFVKHLGWKRIYDLNSD